MVHLTSIRQKEHDPVSISRHVRSDDDRSSCPHEPTLRHPSQDENLNVEPVLQSADINYGETFVNKD